MMCVLCVIYICTNVYTWNDMYFGLWNTNDFSIVRSLFCQLTYFGLTFAERLRHHHYITVNV